MIDAAVGASAHRVIAVTPWYGYSRQDKKSMGREPISARLVARVLEVAGADRVLTMDLHAGQIQGFFQKPVDHMTAMSMLTQYLRDLQPRGPRGRLARRRPREAGQEVRREGGRRAGDPQQGAPRPAGRRDRLRDRRRQGPQRGDRRRHDRHRGHAARRGRDGDRRGRQAGLRRRHAPGALRQRVREPRRLAVRADRRHRHDPAARRARRTTSRSCPSPTC